MRKAAVTALIFTCAGWSQAAEINKHANDFPSLNAIAFRGEIVEGDAFRLKSYISKLPMKKTTAIYLESPHSFLINALSKKSDELYFISNSEALETGINVWDEERSEMVYSKISTGSQNNDSETHDCRDADCSFGIGLPLSFCKCRTGSNRMVERRMGR
jgi:hypothetical protein